MKHLIIKNLEPLAEADLNLSKTNIIVGPQSSVKSYVLKSVCYCARVEKFIQKFYLLKSIHICIIFIIIS